MSGLAFRSATDFRQAAGSTTINNGSPASTAGALDLNGNLRTVGPAPDIGVYEDVPAPAIGLSTVTDITDTRATARPVVATNGGRVTLTVSYGTTSGGPYPLQKIVTVPASGGLASPAVPLTGLTPSTTYFARAQADSDGGAAATAQYSFTTPAPPAPGDSTKPVLGSLRLSPTVFRAAKSGGSISAKRKVGTKVTFTLSEASRVTFSVQRKTRGRKVGKTCRAKKRSNAKRKACTRWVKVKGSFTVAGKAGKNSFKFRGRIRRKSLKRGAYRLSGQAIDSASNKSVFRRKGFRIVR